MSGLSSPISSVPIKWIWFLASYTLSSCRRRRVICWSYLHKVMMAPGSARASKQRCDWAALSLPALGAHVSVRGSPGISVTQGSKARREDRWGEERERGELINSAEGERSLLMLEAFYDSFLGKREWHQRAMGRERKGVLLKRSFHDETLSLPLLEIIHGLSPFGYRTITSSLPF